MTVVHKNNEFVNEIVFPKQIILSEGCIENADNLLVEKDLQITTDEPECTIIKNSGIHKKSYILLDFGKEINGKLRLLTHTVSGCDLADIRITYGESVTEALSKTGKNGSTNDHALRDFVISVPRYSDMSFIETGFRYAKIELKESNAQIRIKAVVAVSIYRDIPYLGSFRCDNEILNRIYDTAAYTCHLSMQQYIWDGIKRDRLVWVGDMHPEMLTVRTVFGPHSIISDSLNFMRKTTPLPLYMNGMPTYSLWWLIIVYDWYLYTGDESFLEENRDYAIGLIKQIADLVNEDSTDNLPAYFLDWPCNDKPEAVSGSRALLVLALNSAEKLCNIYGVSSLATLCKSKADTLLKSPFESFGAKQVIAFGSLAGWVDAQKAAQDILTDGAVGWSTFMSYYLLKASRINDISASLYALISYYGGMLEAGATTFWEDFDISWLADSVHIDEIPHNNKRNIHSDFGRFCYKGLRHSLCHGWSSAPTAFLAEEVLGIKILEAGCRSVEISPELGFLRFAKGTYPTPLGVIEVCCEATEKGVVVKYNAPDSIKITVTNAIFGGKI